MATINTCKDLFVIDLVQGLLEPQSTAKAGTSPQILDLQNMEVITSTELPYTPTCDPETVGVVLAFRSGAACGGTVAVLQATFEVTVSDTDAIVNNSVFTVVFGSPDVVLPQVTLVSSDANIVVDNPLVGAFRVVSAAALTQPIVLIMRVGNPGCVALAVTARITNITPLASGWEMGTSDGDTLQYH